MDEIPEYKLIRSVDPNTVKIPLKEKFAKLTLSSNKKKAVPENQMDEQGIRKRQSVSRNLMETAVETKKTDERLPTEYKGPLPHESGYINPLLRSKSSSNDNTTQKEVDELNFTEDMDPLEITEDLSQPPDEMEHQLDKLSEQISSLAVSSKPAVPTTDSKSSELQPAQTILPKPELQAQVTICSSETSEDESDEVITISDSSVSCPDNIRTEPDFDLMTSDIPRSGETADAFLPSTISNEKADRIEAFLRDVFFERKEMERQAELSTKSDQEIVPETDKDGDTDPEKVDRAKRLASAETEPMSLKSNQFEESLMENTFERKNRQMALGDTMPSSQMTHCSLLEGDSSAVIMRNSNRASRRLAHDETEENTIVSEEPSHIANEIDTTFNSTKSPPPEESIVIPETSSEDESVLATPGKQIVPSDEFVPETSSEAADKEVIPSDEIASGSSTPIQSQLSQIQMSMGSINISAKINIKIHISGLNVSDGQQSDDDDNNDDDDDGGDVGCASVHKTRTPSLPATEENSEAPFQPKLVENERPKAAAKTPERSEQDVDDEFLTHAEKLLNQLYGKSWQTPDVIRTLKQSSGKDVVSTAVGESTPVNRKHLIIKKSAQQKPCGKDIKTVEETVLDDFSIFRHNIVQTNLDSTRLKTPKQQPANNKGMQASKAWTEIRRPTTTKSSSSNQHNGEKVFKMPQTEGKRLPAIKRMDAERWKQLIDDDDSESANASDDESVNKTFDEEDEKISDPSWNQCSSDSADSEYEDDVNVRYQTRRRPQKKSDKTTKPKTAVAKKQAAGGRKKLNSKNQLIYLDLSRDEVTVLEGTPATPPANNDANFNNRLQDVLRTCRYEDKPKLMSTPTPGRSKRKLFTANFGEEDEEINADSKANTPTRKLNAIVDDDDLLQEIENIDINLDALPFKYEVINKKLESVKTGKPIFQITPPRTPAASNKDSATTAPKNNRKLETAISKTPKIVENDSIKRFIAKPCFTPYLKYGFLKSLDVCVSKCFCHPDALYYRENYRQKKEELSKKLYDLYNEKLFGNELNVPLIWNKKLSNTAGRCINKTKLGIRTSVVELSEKVLTSGDRLRCTLIHELCHAAAWVFNGEGGHGATWKEWARKANIVFPELPKIGVCHQYDIEYKYTYKCILCGAKSHAHSKSKKVDNIRCSFCHGAIEIFLNKKDKDGNIIPTPVKEPTGFAKFVKENYKQFKQPDLKHADIMKLLSSEFAALKVAGNAK